MEHVCEELAYRLLDLPTPIEIRIEVTVTCLGIEMQQKSIGNILAWFLGELVLEVPRCDTRKHHAKYLGNEKQLSYWRFAP
jgi:hypothetical protein